MSWKRVLRTLLSLVGVAALSLGLILGGVGLGVKACMPAIAKATTAQGASLCLKSVSRICGLHDSKCFNTSTNDPVWVWQPATIKIICVHGSVKAGLQAPGGWAQAKRSCVSL